MLSFLSVCLSPRNPFFPARKGTPSFSIEREGTMNKEAEGLSFPFLSFPFLSFPFGHSFEAIPLDGPRDSPPQRGKRKAFSSGKPLKAQGLLLRQSLAPSL